MSSSDPVKILLVEDQAVIAMVQVKKLHKWGYDVTHVLTGEGAVEHAVSDPALSLVLMDIDLGPGIDGPEAAKQILARRDLPVVFLTGHAEQEMVERVRAITRYGYVLKNSGDFVLHSAIEMALQLFEAHRRTEHELSRNAALLSAIPDLVFVMDANGRFLDVHAPDPANLVVPPDRVIGMNLKEVFPADEAERHLELYRRCRETGEHQRLEYQLASDGVVRTYEARIVRMDQDHLLAITRDVTEDRRREQADRAAGERELVRKLDFQKLVARVSADFMGATPEETDTVVQRTLAQLGQYLEGGRCYLMEVTMDPRTLRQTYEWTAPEVAPVITQRRAVPIRDHHWIVERILSGETVQIADVRELPDEAAVERDTLVSRGVISLLAVPLVSATRTMGYLGIHTVHSQGHWSADEMEQMRVVGEIISNALERRRARMDLAREQLLMNVLMDNSPDYIYFKDRESRFIRVSRSMAQLHGYEDPRSVIGLSDADRLGLEATRRRIEHERRIIETGEPVVDLEEEERLPDGTVRWHSTSKSPLRDEQGAILGIFGITRDITERQNDRIRLEAYARDQELLLREVHHRIKNTMNTIRSLVAVHEAQASHDEAFGIIRDLQARLVGMISVYDHIDSAADFRSVSVPDYLETLLDGIAESFGEDRTGRIQRSLESCTMDSRVVFPLGLIVNELVTNSLKHRGGGGAGGACEAGHINIHVTLVGTGDGWELHVRDTGPGLPDGFSVSRGAGFGLGLVRALVDQIHGVFSISSVVGAGGGAGTGGTLAVVRFPGT